MLHMTTFFLGGSRAVMESLQRFGDVLQGQGSSWRVRGGHLVYAEDALLVLSLYMEPDSPPQDPDCLPHTTLLFKEPFTPAHANDVLRAAWCVGLLADAPLSQTNNEAVILAAKEVEVAGRMLTLYAQRVPSTVVFESRLEAFWSARAPAESSATAWLAAEATAPAMRKKTGMTQY